MAIYTTTGEQTGRHGVLKKRAGEPQEDETRKRHRGDTASSPANPLSDVEFQNPIGKVHAGEVTRRTDRQASALPPSDPSTSSQRATATTTGGGGHRRAAPGGGGNGSDSDSDHDKRGELPGGGDVPVPTRPRRPLALPDENPIPHYNEAVDSQLAAPLDEESEMRKHRCMREMLRYLEPKVMGIATLRDLPMEQRRLLNRMPADERRSHQISKTTCWSMWIKSTKTCS
jgi:hypothetical protein